MLFAGILFLLLTLLIFCEGEPDAPAFLALPRCPLDYMRIVMHALEFAVIAWPIAGGFALGIYASHEVAVIEVLLSAVLCIASVVSRKIAPRFAKQGFAFALGAGLLAVPSLLGLPRVGHGLRLRPAAAFPCSTDRGRPALWRFLRTCSPEWRPLPDFLVREIR